MAMKPKKETYTSTTKGNKVTETWTNDDGSGSSKTYTKPDPNLDSKFGREVPKPKATAKPKATPKAKPKTTPKATPKATAKAKPLTEAQKQAKAMDKLMAKRKAVSKKTGSWPNYNTN